MGLDGGYLFYKAGSENLNVCLGCDSDIELRLFLHGVGATETLSTRFCQDCLTARMEMTEWASLINR